MPAVVRRTPGRFLGDDDGRVRESFTTPEGVPIEMRIASAGDRIGAFLFDAMWLGIALTLICFSLSLLVRSVSERTSNWVMAIWLFVSFVLRNCYFTWFECRRQGTTPGKSRLGLRVVDRAGGRLSTEAIVVRNATREIELFLPLAVLVQPQLVIERAPAAGAILSVLWIVLIGALPLLNRYHLRLGDLLAGTMVVAVPKKTLHGDLAGRPASPVDQPAVAPAEYTFSNKQLDIYGNYEVQVLESVLRKSGKPGQRDTLVAIAEKVKTKIGWSRDRWNVPARPFLEAFYAAQRARLEQKMLLGQRQEYKKTGP
jgi:uncharacterized RDD family membrane protein YckC